METFAERCTREDEEDRLASIRNVQVPNLTGPQAVELAVACLMQAYDRKAISGWNITLQTPEDARG